MCYGASDCSVASEWMVDHNYGEAGEMTSVKGDGRHLSAKPCAHPLNHTALLTAATLPSMAFPFPSPNQRLTSQICFICQIISLYSSA